MVYHPIVVQLHGCSKTRHNPSLSRPFVSPLENGEWPKSVDDDMQDVYLSNIKMILKLSEWYVPLMSIGQLDIILPIKEKQSMIQGS